MGLATIDVTAIIVASIAALGSIVSASVTAFVVYLLRTPSGDRIGKVMERTHENTAVTTMGVTTLLEQLGEPPRDPQGTKGD